MSPGKPGIGTHYRRYATGNLLVILAGLVSFPLFSRLLDNTQYGMFGYYSTFVVMAVAVGKLGAQHAILRFYPHGGDPARLQAFSTNLFYVPLAITLTLWALIAIGLVTLDWTVGLRQSPLFWLVLVAAPLAVFGSLVDTVLRVTERSQMVMYSRAGSRWLDLVLMLAAVALIQRSAVAAYSGKLATSLLMVSFYAWWMRRHLGFSRAAVDPVAIREGLFYGMPLVLNEIIAVALISLDRLMLKGMTGDFAAVGIYSIGASLAVQVSVFMNSSVFEAFLPIANRLYVTEGAAAVRALKSSILLPMTYAAVGVAILLGSFGSDLIIAASGSTKAASGPVFALLGIVSALQPVLLLSGYGLLLEKRSTKVMVLMCVTLLVNTALNLLWIPSHGVMGSVYATAVSSAVLAVAHCAWVPRSLLQLPDLRVVVTAVSVALFCIVVALLSGMFNLHPGWQRLLVGGGSMALLYALAVLTLDPRVRGLLRGWHRSGFVERATATN